MTDGSDPWTVWLDRHLRALILFARQWTPRRADAEDVVQEAFVRFWNCRDRVADPAAYVYACVKHVALNSQRSHGRRSKREEVSARSEGETLFTDPLELDERRAAIEAALRGLPVNQREVLVMRIWGGLSFTQIATTLEISDNTAKSRYRYALAKLAAHQQKTIL